jgi:hypothetical protein
VPLHADHVRQVGTFYGFDHAVGRGRRDDEAGGGFLDCLVMPAVDQQHVAFEAVGHQLRQLGACRDPHFMRRGGRRCRHLVIERSRDAGGDVLHERSTGRDVEHLDAAADRQQRQAAIQRRAREGNLELVAPGLRRGERLVRRLAVQLRVHVAAAAQHQGVEPVERGHRILLGGKQTPFEADPFERVLVVGDARALGESDNRHHILTGTAMPIRSSAAVSCERT